MHPSSQPQTQGHRLRSGGVASNYAIALFGVFFAPILIIALVFALRRRRSAQDWERTHYELQFRTALPVALVQILTFGIGAAILIVSPPEVASGPGEFAQFSIVSTLIGYAVTLWALMRLGRGLYLAGSKTPLAASRSHSIWPC